MREWIDCRESPITAEELPPEGPPQLVLRDQPAIPEFLEHEIRNGAGIRVELRMMCGVAMEMKLPIHNSSALTLEQLQPALMSAYGVPLRPGIHRIALDRRLEQPLSISEGHFGNCHYLDQLLELLIDLFDYLV